jgi:hypothetical protein
MVGHFPLGLILSQPEQFMLLSNWSSGAQDRSEIVRSHLIAE